MHMGQKFSKSQENIINLMYMDKNKLFAKKKNN